MPIYANDYHNDADLDLFPGFFLPSFFENSGDLSFIERPFQAGLPGTSLLSDSDGDGFIDVYVNGSLYRNQGGDHHYLAIDLVGVTSNRDGIGAVVFATTGDIRQRRDLRGGNGWVQREGVLHFGLGEAST